MTIKAKKIISDLFDLYIKEPDLLPKQWNNFTNNKENICGSMRLYFWND